MLLSRQLPLSSFFINILLGLTAVRTRDFMIGSLIGFLPEAIPAALIGAGVVQEEPAAVLQYVLVGAVVFVALVYLLHRLRQQAARRNPDLARTLTAEAGREGDDP